MMKINQQLDRIEVPKVLQPFIDQDEYEAAIRTARAHIRARELGVKLSYSIAKKFYCRCSKVFVYPDKFLAHRLSCAVLIRDQELLNRKPKSVVLVEEIKQRKRIEFECLGCNFIFHSKPKLKHHQLICHSYKAHDEIVQRGREYLERNKRGKKDVKGNGSKKAKGKKCRIRKTKKE